ncbi:hypothetical protein M407DRAFT_229955 [Tulasnella calospora MUT 4182]|uniref:Uncharacterized protein n=1 Tax=Tulasnella calospora MUT 4182 TaxID=1051891 RepID=A0A0C3K6I3_9AGAM|nr:hypothetical protein M407DRAFT_229955 [Tulasnella calospora MUT 4182]
MILSCFQLLLTLLRRFLACIQHILQLATSSPTISTALPLECEREPKALINVEKPDKHDHRLDQETNAVLSKPLPHLLQPLYLSERILVLIKQALPAESPGGDELEGVIPRHGFDRAKVQTVGNSLFAYACPVNNDIGQEPGPFGARRRCLGALR